MSITSVKKDPLINLKAGQFMTENGKEACVTDMVFRPGQMERNMKATHPNF